MCICMKSFSGHLLFFVLIFLAHIVTSYPLVWGDSFTSRYLPMSIIRELNFDLNEFDFPYDKQIPYFLQYRNGRIVSSYPVSAALTAIPFYLVPVLLGIGHQSPWIPVLEKASTASITLLSALLLSLTVKRLATKRASLFVTAVDGMHASATCWPSTFCCGVPRDTTRQRLPRCSFTHAPACTARYEPIGRGPCAWSTMPKADCPRLYARPCCSPHCGARCWL
jgi:hypothetical protein